MNDPEPPEPGDARRRLIVVRGLPGSGRSSVARNFGGSSGVIVDADPARSEQGHGLSALRMASAHLGAMDAVARAIESGAPSIIVEGSMPRLFQVRDFFEQASAAGYSAAVISPDTVWARDPVECAARSRSGLSVRQIEQLAASFQAAPDREAILYSKSPSERLADCRIQMVALEAMRPREPALYAAGRASLVFAYAEEVMTMFDLRELPGQSDQLEQRMRRARERAEQSPDRTFAPVFAEPLPETLEFPSPTPDVKPLRNDLEQ